MKPTKRNYFRSLPDDEARLESGQTRHMQRIANDPHSASGRYDAQNTSTLSSLITHANGFMLNRCQNGRQLIGHHNARGSSNATSQCIKMRLLPLLIQTKVYRWDQIGHIIWYIEYYISFRCHDCRAVLVIFAVQITKEQIC